jgi:hypothetical protein
MANVSDLFLHYMFVMLKCSRLHVTATMAFKLCIQKVLAAVSSFVAFPKSLRQIQLTFFPLAEKVLYSHDEAIVNASGPEGFFGKTWHALKK